MKFAILLPVTSRGKPATIHDDLNKLIQELAKNSSQSLPLKVFFGVNEDDDYLKEEQIDELMQESKLEYHYLALKPHKTSEPVPICSYWRKLAGIAYQENCDYYLLLGDDVEISCAHTEISWPTLIHRQFQDSNLPGFGCVALTDKNSPGFCTFPVVSKLHMDIFQGQIIPSEFINQDGDPYLWELYRRFNGSNVIKEVMINNEVGGVQLAEDDSYQQPRYDRRHIDWKGSLLQEQVNTLNEWVADHKHPVPSVNVIDILVPSYRVERSYLSSIIKLLGTYNRDRNNLMIIIIIDNPAADIKWLRDIESEHLRIRKNEANLGASETRNVGLRESAADWVLFLDDDVIPHPTIVDEYVQSIEEFGREYAGFVGLTVLPLDARKIDELALKVSGISYFWDIALKQNESPWGITANMLVSRLGSNRDIYFDLKFLKTGGGEDIDFCLQLVVEKKYLKTVATAVCDHKLWTATHRHVYNWGHSDSLLISKYPKLSYLNFPNLVETVAILAIMLVLFTYYELKNPLTDSTMVWYLIMKFVIAVLILCVWDVAIDVWYITTDPTHKSLLANKRMVEIICLGFLSNSSKNAVEAGHFIGPLMRKELSSLLHRFDWFAGKLEDFRQNERLKALFAFIGYVVVLAILYIH
jgi:glycosyltransferase involved in cell wall biosynthesis